MQYFNKTDSRQLYNTHNMHNWKFKPHRHNITNQPSQHLSSTNLRMHVLNTKITREIKTMKVVGQVRESQSLNGIFFLKEWAKGSVGDYFRLNKMLTNQIS